MKAVCGKPGRERGVGGPGDGLAGRQCQPGQVAGGRQQAAISKAVPDCRW